MPFRDFVNNYNFDADNFDFDVFKAAAIEEFGKDEGVFTAKISKLEEDGNKTAKELRDTKVANYDLLKALPGETSKTGTPEPDLDDAESTSISDLFGTKKE